MVASHRTCRTPTALPTPAELASPFDRLESTPAGRLCIKANIALAEEATRFHKGHRNPATLTDRT